MISSFIRTKKPNCILLYSVLITGLLAGNNAGLSAQDSWTTTLETVGTFSSPRVADLNQDNVLDIIIGAGREEFQACDSAVIALDGKTGALLWKVPAKDQIFGSAIFEDLNEDGFVGGADIGLLLTLWN